MKPRIKIAATGHLTGRAVEEWRGATPDSTPPVKVVDRLFLRQMGRCAISGVKIMPRDKTAVDHIVPLKDGGANRESNLQIILVSEHKKKTAREASDRAKVARIRAKHHGYFPKPKRPLKSRGFEKRSFNTGPDT